MSSGPPNAPPDWLASVFSWDRLFSAVSRVRLRGGVIGKLTTTLMVIAIAISFICWSFPDKVVALCGLGVVLVLALVLGWRMLNFAERNPYAATLEGAELLVHQQLQQGMKGQPQLPYDPSALTIDTSVPSPLFPADELNKPDEVAEESEPTADPKDGRDGKG